MDRRLLNYYNRDLRHLRQSAGEFARAHPKIAHRLALDEAGVAECPDPYVERLLEGVAFLTARVQVKLDAEFPRLTQGIFETVHPHYLCPIPSMAMIRYAPDLTEGALGDGVVVPRGSLLHSRHGESEKTKCAYTTAHDVTLWPLEIEEAEYHTRDISVLGITGSRDVRAALRLRLRATAGLKFDELPLDRLVLHVTGAGEIAMGIYEQILTHAMEVVVHPTARPPKWREGVTARNVGQVGFEDAEALLPYGARSFQGYRLMEEYFNFPARFMFLELAGLEAGLRRCTDSVVDVSVLLDDVSVELENEVSRSNFALFCTPAVNLKRKSLDRIHLSDRFSEFHVVADRTAPLDWEVHSIESVTGFGIRGSADEQPFESFYSARDMATSRDVGYYAANRVPRTPTDRERRGRRRTTSYAGSEVYVSLVDTGDAPYDSELRELGIEAICTNRDLPIHMPLGHTETDFTLDAGAPVESIRCVGTPTTPRPSRAEKGDIAWRLVSHLTLNYLSILDTEGGDAGSALRDLLRLYGDTNEPQIRKQIDAVQSVASRPIIRRVGAGGPTAFARGLEVTVTMDEGGFQGSGVFLLGAVLDRFFAKYVSLNAFTETVIRTVQRGEVKRWPARIGQRHVL